LSSSSSTDIVHWLVSVCKPAMKTKSELPEIYHLLRESMDLVERLAATCRRPDAAPAAHREHADAVALLRSLAEVATAYDANSNKTQEQQRILDAALRQLDVDNSQQSTVAAAPDDDAFLERAMAEFLQQSTASAPPPNSSAAAAPLPFAEKAAAAETTQRAESSAAVLLHQPASSSSDSSATTTTTTTAARLARSSGGSALLASVRPIRRVFFAKCSNSSV
jgi:hypothetical protein